MAKADSLAGAFDQARNISHNKSLAAVNIHHAQMWIHGGEMVIGNLRACITDTGEKRGFSNIRKSYQTDIRDNLELQLDPELLAGLSRLGILRRLHGWSGEVHIALTAVAAL